MRLRWPGHWQTPGLPCVEESAEENGEIRGLDWHTEARPGPRLQLQVQQSWTGWEGLLPEPASELMPGGEVHGHALTLLLAVSVRPAPSFLGQSSPGAHPGACGPDGDTVGTEASLSTREASRRRRPAPALHSEAPLLPLLPGSWSQPGLGCTQGGRPDAHWAAWAPLGRLLGKEAEDPKMGRGAQNMPGLRCENLCSGADWKE